MAIDREWFALLVSAFGKSIIFEAKLLFFRDDISLSIISWIELDKSSTIHQNPKVA